MHLNHLNQNKQASRNAEQRNAENSLEWLNKYKKRRMINRINKPNLTHVLKQQDLAKK